MDLQTLGFSSFFSEQHTAILQSCAHDKRLTLARIARVDGTTARLLLEDRSESVVAIPARLRRAGTDSPVVGDWVMFDPDHCGQATMTHVLSRRTQISRAAAGIKSNLQVLAANVDVVFIVMGLDGDFNPRRVERYIATISDGGARPVLFLTKAAACTTLQDKLAQIQLATQEIDLHVIDVIDGIGEDIPQQYLQQGVTIALLGSSGAGKSTLVNHLMQQDVMPTGDVRKDDHRGRHTTTHRQLLLPPQGGIVIDNPGIRELSLWIQDSGLETAFFDVTEQGSQCRFNDCSHQHEPDCAVQKAVASGKLGAGRVQRYLELRKEAFEIKQRREEYSRQHTRPYQYRPRKTRRQD